MYFQDVRKLRGLRRESGCAALRRSRRSLRFASALGATPVYSGICAAAPEHGNVAARRIAGAEPASFGGVLTGQPIEIIFSRGLEGVFGRSAVEGEAGPARAKPVRR